MVAAPGFASEDHAVAHVLVPELDGEVVVAGHDGRHLARVRRLRPGEPVTAADGAGRWRAYDVAAVSGSELRLVARGDVRWEPRLVPRLAVAFAPIKGQRPELVVSGLTELGVDRMLVVRAARSVVRWEHERASAATARLERVVREAAMQSRRAWLPDVAVGGTLGALGGHPGLVLADRRGHAEVPLPVDGEWLLVVGPEGGLDPDERAVLGRWPVLGVGPHVLRAETAAIAAAAVLASRRRPAPELDERGA